MFSLDIISPDRLDPVQISEENISYTSYNVNQMALWKLETTFQLHWDFITLNPSRSNVILVLAVPSFMTNLDFFKFVQQVVPVNHKITILNYYYRSAIIEFSTQEGADAFYTNTIGLPFDSNHEHIRCISLFLLEIEPNIKISPIPTCEKHCEKQIPLPICPLCFQLFDPLITTFFSGSSIEDISEQSYALWGKSNCPVCQILHSQSFIKKYKEKSTDTTEIDHEIKCKYENCNETDELWLCMECGHIGCGRNKKHHALDHYVSTNHRFSLLLSTDFYIWDYVADVMVSRSFQDRPTQATEDTLMTYRKILLEEIKAVRFADEKERQKILKNGKTEIDDLQMQLQELENEEKAMENDYQDVQKLNAEYESIQKELDTVRNSPDMKRSDQLQKSNSALKKQLNQMSARVTQLIQYVENNGDISDGVVIEYQ